MTFFLAHLLLAYLVLGEPVIGLRWSEALRRRSDALKRERAYLGTVAWQWSIVAVLAVLVLAGATSLERLRLSAPDLGSVGLTSDGGAAGMAVGFALGIAVNLVIIARVPRIRAALERLSAGFEHLLPRTRRERWLWVAVAVTAGVTEELLYRGFVLDHLTTHFGFELDVAVVLSAVVFGVAHLYQGWKGVLLTGLVGWVMASLTVRFDSLLPAMVVHTVVDLRLLLLRRSKAPSR